MKIFPLYFQLRQNFGMKQRKNAYETDNADFSITWLYQVGSFSTMKIQDYLCLNNNHIWISHIILGMNYLRGNVGKGSCNYQTTSRPSWFPQNANLDDNMQILSTVISPSRTAHSWLLPMVCIPWRDPRVNNPSAQEDQDLSGGQHSTHVKL